MYQSANKYSRYGRYYGRYYGRKRGGTPTRYLATIDGPLAKQVVDYLNSKHAMATSQVDKDFYREINTVQDLPKLLLIDNLPEEILHTAVVLYIKVFEELTPEDQLKVWNTAYGQYGNEAIARLKKPENKADKNFVRQMLHMAIEESPKALMMATEKWQKKLIAERVWRSAFRKDPSIFYHIPPKFRTAEQWMRHHKKFSKLKDTFIEVKKARPELPMSVENILGRGFGIELEFLCSDKLREWFLLLLREIAEFQYADDPREANDYSTWWMTRDNTAKDVFELKSPVVKTAGQLEQLLRVLSCFEILGRDKILVVDDRCGLHIHRSAEHLSYDNVLAIEKFYAINSNNLVSILDMSRHYNGYCLMQIGNALIDEEDRALVEAELRNMHVDDLKKHKFSALNTLAYFYLKTVEFRQHQGTFDFCTILAWLELTARIMEMCDDPKRFVFLTTFLDVLGVSKFTREFYLAKFMENCIHF